ncbi:hypothetical protein KC19_9G090300 [Ceratodon purpureus]|uniref:Uncharacterized protein n=1 Tax=Ceratodon purpureus TaxID=3225 RepID=A0A8T0GT75_CERPU|nr:hypothetical protein KC19_9G090300 [Ceratodon purpureus]
MERECGKLGSSMSSSFRRALYVVSMACLWTMVAAQAAARPPISDPPAREGSPRELVSTVWGFILNFMALTLDHWGIVKNAINGPFLSSGKVVQTIFSDPMLHLYTKLEYALTSCLWRIQWLSTPKESVYIRTLISCKVVVNLSPAAYDDFHGKLDKLHEDVEVQDFSDVFVLGNEVLGCNETNVQLTATGKAMLVKAGVLPPVERLKILQGNSGAAVAVCAAQGGGYIYGILVRVVQGLHVSPIEVIGFYVSIHILVRAVCHYFTSSCHRPLYLFLEDEMEKEFIKKCQEFEGDKDLSEAYSSLFGSKYKLTYKLAIFVVYSLLCVILVFFLIYGIRSTSLRMVIPLIILISSLFSSFLSTTIFSDKLKHFYYYISPILHYFVYIYSLYFTIKYWDSFGYDIPSRGYLSKVLPYIG